MLDFAMKVCLHSQDIDDADHEALYPHGFDDEDIWDIAAITAFFGLSNRMASFAGMLPNPEFYSWVACRARKGLKPAATGGNSLASICATGAGMAHHPSQSSGRTGKALLAGGLSRCENRLLPRRARGVLRHSGSCCHLATRARAR